MLELEQRGINFRQAQGIEGQCPHVGIIEIAEALIGKRAEELVKTGHYDRNAFCHLTIDVKQMSDGIPQFVEKAILSPEMACNLTCGLLLKQLNLVAHNISSEEVPSSAKKEIIDRWKKVITEKKLDSSNNTLTRKGVTATISQVALQLQLIVCGQAPQPALIDNSHGD